MDAGTPVGNKEQFGSYRAVRQIGSGGMASIYEARDTRLGHKVAIKRLHPHIASRPGAADRFLREGRAAARIRHPHVVQVLALGSEDASSPYLAMELLEGCDLGDLLAREGRLGVTEAVGILLPVIAGVGAAHDAGVVHRDLKPSNVFIAKGPRGRPWPKVLDFGVSKVLEADGGSPSTATDGVLGTVAYMAPEQARAARNASFGSDQYSLAVILYQCLTGELPFTSSGMYDLVVAIMTAPLVPPGQRVEGIPPELDAVVLRAMSREAVDRFPSVRAFGAALLPLASERDRVAWAAELHDAEIPVEKSAPAAGAIAADSPATMSPTARDTRASSRWQGLTVRRVLSVGAWIALAAAGGAAVMMREPRSSTTESQFSSVAKPAVTTESNDNHESLVTIPAVSTTSVASAPTAEAVAPAARTPSPPVVRPASPARTRPVVAAPVASTASTLAPSPVPSASQRPGVPAIGDNGAPILP